MFLRGLRLFCLVGTLVWATSWAAEPTLVEIEDLYRVDTVVDLAVSPDSVFAVYCRHWVEGGEQRNSLWRFDGKPTRPRALEDGQPDARHPLFSPDGKWIAFVSSRPFVDGTPAFRRVPSYSDPAGDIWFLQASGGKAIPLAGKGKPYGRVMTDSFYGNIAFSPDGRRLVFVADEAADSRTPREIAAGVRVVREDQGEGYEGYGPAQIWVAELAAEPSQRAAVKIARVTHDRFWYGDPQWSPDGRWLIVHANRTKDQESVRYSINKDYNLWRIDLAREKLEPITDGPGPEVWPRISPDGRRLVCLSVPRRGPHADVYNLMVVDLDRPKPEARVLFDHHGPGADQPPHWQPGSLPRNAWLDANRFMFDGVRGLASERQVIDLRDGPTATPIKDLASDDPYRKREEVRRRLSPPAVASHPPRLRAADQVVRWKSFDGLDIDGVLTVPPDKVARKPYKLVVMPHGGPHARATSGSGLAAQVFAAHGYAVFQPNFRGTAGYGLKFLDADRFDLGGGDMRDILTGIDHLVREKIVAPRRQFVYGVSYGGYMTCWLVGHTQQFRAAVAQNAVTDLNAMWHLSDLQSWTEWEFGGRPWEVHEAMKKHSPITYAAQVRTPTLLLHSAQDRRCPLAMGTMFYRALKSHGVKTEMVVYPDEGHPIRQLKHQEDVLRRVLAWFAENDPDR